MSVVLVLLLGACVGAPEGVPTPEAPEPRSRLAVTRTFDPTVVPTNRFGLDCGELASEQQLTDLVGAPMPFRLGADLLTVPYLEALLQDGALVCRWGEGPYIDGPIEEVQIVVASGDRAGFEAAVAAPGSSESSPTMQMPGVGEAAWATCRTDLGFARSCDWSVFQSGAWIAARFGGLPETEIDVVEVSEWQSTATARADSQSAGILAAVARLVSQSPPISQTPPVLSSPDCASIVDWASVAAALGLEGVAVRDRFQELSDAGQPLALDIVIARDAAQRQGVRYCSAEVGAWTEATRPVWISLKVLPAGAWLSSTGLWRPPDLEACHGWEGGPLCDTVGYDGPRAAYVAVGGDRREGAGQLVLDALKPAS